VRVLAIPVKSLSRAKTRLAPVFSPLERAALTLAMLEDVLDAALPAAGWETWVISPDEAVLEIAARRKARPVTEAKPPLSAAVRQVEEETTERDAHALGILLGDLPLLTADALTAALQTLGPVVVAPSSTDRGTNLLVRRPPRAVGARFGRDSLRKHVQAAEARHLPVAVIDRPELTTDLDLPEHVLSFLATGKGGRTREVCMDMDVAGRFAARP
jgi:2-phospho-L-lactate guanylyltransferase